MDLSKSEQGICQKLHVDWSETVYGLVLTALCGLVRISICICQKLHVCLTEAAYRIVKKLHLYFAEG